MALRALALVTVVRLMLWVLPSTWTLRIVRWIDSRPAREGPLRLTIPLIVWAIEAVSARIPKATCLTQAISAQILLHHYGYRPRLCLGIDRASSTQFRAHAWLDLDGRVVIGGRPNASLTPLPSISGADRSWSLSSHR